MADDLDERAENLLCHLYQLVYGDSGLGICGCGWPDDGLALVHELLTAFGAGADGGAWERRQDAIQQLLPTDAVRHLVLSMLDRAGLMEHGSSVLGAWLTPRGKWWLWGVEQVGGIDGLNAAFGGPGVGFPHEGDTECAEACWRTPDGWRPDGAAPKPEGSLLERVSAAIEAESEKVLARITPEQREAWEASRRAMENVMLYGSPDGPGAVPRFEPAPQRLSLRFNQQTKTWEAVQR